MFVGFVSAGVPLGVTFSSLLAAPMVNEVAVVLLFGLVGWRIAVAAGLGIGRMRQEGWLEERVRALRTRPLCAPSAVLNGPRGCAPAAAAPESVGRVSHRSVSGIAVGAPIPGYAPAELLAGVAGAERRCSVPAAGLVGVSLYANAAGIVPVVEALLAEGSALEIVPAFMMAAPAPSLADTPIRRKVLQTPLIPAFAGAVATGMRRGWRVRAARLLRRAFGGCDAHDSALRPGLPTLRGDRAAHRRARPRARCRAGDREGQR